MLNEFLDTLFGEQQGFVYAPIKSLTSFRFYQKFFDWPNERELLVNYITTKSKNFEVYISPCLFTERRVSPDTFKGTYHVWAEFDGKLPDSVPLQPSLIIQSSKNGYAHWYWKLNQFTTDTEAVTAITKKLTYHLNADRSGWDYAQILRPPGTHNHKRDLPVKLQVNEDFSYDLADFDTLPDPPVATVPTPIQSVEELPKIDPVIARYPWKDDTYELFTKAVKRGHRSDALVRLAFDCVEMGMSNVEVITILEDADRRWKKFYGRTDRLKRLFGILEYVRTQKTVQAELETTPTYTVYRFLDFLNTNVQLEWVVTGILPVAGSGVIYGPGGVGKSTLSLRMGMSIALGEERFLRWPIERQVKVLFISLEMPHDELKSFFVDMDLPQQTVQVLQNNFFLWPIGHAYPLDVREYQQEALRYVDMHEINLIIVDSLAVAMYGSVTSDDDIKRLNSFFNEDLRKERNCGYWLIHHPHKPDAERKGTVYDMFGSVYIGNNAQTIINMKQRYKGTNRFTLEVLKNRLSLDSPKFEIFRKEGRSFEVVNSASNGDSQDTDDEREEGVSSSRKGLFGALG